MVKIAVKLYISRDEDSRHRKWEGHTTCTTLGGGSLFSPKRQGGVPFGFENASANQLLRDVRMPYGGRDVQQRGPFENKGVPH